ncbi:hypothetical protein H696_04715 [Fonticula alba]|uniref:Uncharacterized protein n=1 Tax=Fonticula alba TaxID=691883 RepID=A0A058Z2S3_FONAL|nr:hypothetical protein H696_04715 [Fonticula alba]KCV68421.1 hypothetical protein H696_04715 [Fonticula alba]|eukprot:XP_009496853.1 hypothetical protein H696_04715 [Fonticula alba]
MRCTCPWDFLYAFLGGALCVCACVCMPFLDAPGGVHMCVCLRAHARRSSSLQWWPVFPLVPGVAPFEMSSRPQCAWSRWCLCLRVCMYVCVPVLSGGGRDPGASPAREMCGRERARARGARCSVPAFAAAPLLPPPPAACSVLVLHPSLLAAFPTHTHIQHPARARTFSPFLPHFTSSHRWR